MKRELIKERSRQWHYDNRDRARERAGQYYQANKETIKEAVARWAQANPDMVRAQHINERARKRAVNGVISGADILRLMQKQDATCFCGASLTDEFHVDHVVPMSAGGTNWPDNLQLLCPPCNLDKGRKPDAEWKKVRGFTD